MKSKKSAYVLLPIVAIVWGIIFYKIFAGAGEDDSLPSDSQRVSTHAAVSAQTDYPLLLNYSDPFLKTHVTLNRPEKQTSILPSMNAEKTIQVHLPELQYRGMIQNGRNKQKVALLIIDNITHMLKAGDSRNDITIVKIWDDSLQLRFKGRQLYIKQAQKSVNEAL